MPPYHGKIKIRREPQIKTVYTEFILPDEYLTLEKLRNYVKEGEKFTITERGDSIFNIIQVLSINRKVEETIKEMTQRIRKEEKYMENYWIFHTERLKKQIETELQQSILNIRIKNKVIIFLCEDNIIRHAEFTGNSKLKPNSITIFKN